MKKQLINLSAPINDDGLVNIVTDSREMDFVPPHQNRTTFTAAQLWHIQHQAKARLQRRYL
jgi:hypothetical protein